jgi:hypothetical protein
MRPMNEEKKKSTTPVGQPLAVDHDAASASQIEPGFIARPPGAPVYHGFQILNDVTADGFTFGKITDFDAAPSLHGDAFVIAPDNSRAGLVWQICDKPYFREIRSLEPVRWGVWDVSFPHAMDSHANVRRNLQSILPELKKRKNGVKSILKRKGNPKRRRIR